jgi:methylase of polypeptide subunit release factors
MAEAGREAEETIVVGARTAGLGALRFLHPPGTFALTPASLIALEAISRQQHLLAGQGLDWGSGTGCLAILAARIDRVRQVIGLEIEAGNVAAARQNAVLNGVAEKVTFCLADSYTAASTDGQALLEECRGRVDFILANPPSSDGDDGLAYRRLVLREGRPYLAPGGIVLLNISYQYGARRVQELAEEIAGYAYGGLLASSEWVPFDQQRPDLRQALLFYAAEEARGGLAYRFAHPEERGTLIDARTAVAVFERSGLSPLTKWQTHLFRSGRD